MLMLPVNYYLHVKDEISKSGKHGFEEHINAVGKLGLSSIINNSVTLGLITAAKGGLVYPAVIAE